MVKRQFAALVVLGFVVVMICSLTMVLIAQAQPASVQGGMMQANILPSILSMVTTMLIPALWVSFGPVATKAITLVVNSWTTKYVPRAVQVPLAGLLGAIIAGLTGDAAGIDPSIAAGIGASVGIGGQVLASLHPDTMAASPPPKAPAS